MADKDIRGRAGELRAARYLTAQGFTLLDRNWRCADGEIDIVAARGEELVVVEVKTRRTDRYGHPFEAVDARKRKRLWRLAGAWVLAHPELARGHRVRLDVVGVTGEAPATAVVEHLVDVR